MFISNKRPSFHLWCKENLVKHRKVSKYYETDCGLASNLASNAINKFERKISGKDAVRKKKGFNLSISNEDMK